MLKGLERRYTLEQIEAQHEDKIRPRLNYDALTTLRNPLYVILGQQVQDASIQKCFVPKLAGMLFFLIVQ